MQVNAPAKINLYLDVTARRPDGYHELVSLMCCIGISDTLRFSFDFSRRPGNFRISCTDPQIPTGPDNLAYKAAAAFFRETGFPPSGLYISIEKTIPAGAGLGGGSSDAAAVLCFLNSRCENPLSRQKLMQLGLSLGADVPFFIFGRPAVAEGIGEDLTEVDGIPPVPVVLIYPAKPVSTAQVYKKLNLALTKSEKINKNFVFKPGGVPDLTRLLFNRLEPVATELCPEIGEARQALLSCGARGALMSGSGSSVFGVFENLRASESAYRELSRHSVWQVFHTRLLT